MKSKPAAKVKDSCSSSARNHVLCHFCVPPTRRYAFFFIFSSLDKEHLRPLYLDVLATTPMVSTYVHIYCIYLLFFYFIFLFTYCISPYTSESYRIKSLYVCPCSLGPSCNGCHDALPDIVLRESPLSYAQLWMGE